MTKDIRLNTILNFIKTFSSIIFPLITFPYITRVLLPSNVGKVNFAVSFVNYFSLIATLGISTYAIRECAAVRERKEKLSNIASQIFSINVITTFISYFLLILTLLLCRNLDNYRTLIIIESTNILFTTLGADWLNAAMEDFKFITIRTLAVQALSFIAMLLFVKNENDYYKYAVISVVAKSGANIINILYRNRYCNTAFVLNIDWKSHMVPILLLFTMSLSQTIFNNADVTMLGIMWNDYEVGIYSTAYRASNIISSVVQSVFFVVMPRLSFYFSIGDYSNINDLLGKLLMLNLGLGLPCFTGVIMLAPDIVQIIGGSEFVVASPVLRILMISFLFSLIGGSFLGNAILLPAKQEKYYMVVCCIAAICNVFLNYILIPPFASVGAAVATAFNGFLIMILLFFKVDKRIHITDSQKIVLAPILGSIAIGIVCCLCSYISNFIMRISCSVLCSIIIYGIILIIFRYKLAVNMLGFICSRISKLCR